MKGLGKGVCRLAHASFLNLFSPGGPGSSANSPTLKELAYLPSTSEHFSPPHSWHSLTTNRDHGAANKIVTEKCDQETN